MVHRQLAQVEAVEGRVAAARLGDDPVAAHEGIGPHLQVIGHAQRDAVDRLGCRRGVEALEARNVVAREDRHPALHLFEREDADLLGRGGKAREQSGQTEEHRPGTRRERHPPLPRFSE